MIEGLAAAFGANLLAELGDKSQLAVLALAGRHHKQAWQVFLGASVGLALATAVSVTVGSLVARALPQALLRPLVALLFILIGAYLFLEKTKKEKIGGNGRNPFLSSLALLLLLEMGDKTQLANALLSAEFGAVGVWVGGTAALVLLTGAASFFGRKVAGRFDERRVREAAALLFVLLGLAILVFNL